MDHLADFSTGDIVKVTMEQCEGFKDIVKKNTEKKRYRLCLHESSNSLLHDSLICRERFSYDRPHKHEKHSETHTILEGSERIVIFSESGEIKDTFLLDREKGYLVYRVNPGTYHTAIPLTDFVLDYETRVGPFSPGDNTFPSWAPDYKEPDLVQNFLKELDARARKNL